MLVDRRAQEVSNRLLVQYPGCLLYTSDAADDLLCVDLGGRRIIKKKKKKTKVEAQKPRNTETKHKNRATQLTDSPKTS